MQIEIVQRAHCCSYCGKVAETTNPVARPEGKLNVNICRVCAEFILKCLLMYPRASSVHPEKNCSESGGLDARVANVEEKLRERRSQYINDSKKDSVSDSAKQLDEKKSAFDFSVFPKPVELKELLDQYVISQEIAKKNTATAIYNHYKRINRLNKDGVKVQKSNILYLGPTGSGKTYAAEMIAKLLNIPFAIVDANSYTEAGYYGDDVENILTLLFVNAGCEKEAAEKGIVFIDEIDKIGKKNNEQEDVSRSAVQQALLKMIEGAKYSVPKKMIKKSRTDELVEIDTSNILFIFGGAFVGLGDIIKARTAKKMIGFGSSHFLEQKESDLLGQVKNEDLIKFGMIPEFLGRIPINIVFEELSQADLVKILTEPKNAIVKQYQELFLDDGVELVFTDEALDEIAKKAIEEKSGARGLRNILESFMQNIMYEVPSAVNAARCIITEKTVRTGEYKLKFHEEIKCL